MEMTVLQAIVLGLVQGITEFLPISSSGHIVLVQYFFGINDPQIGFVIALHVGSLLAVLIYFWRDWLNLFHIKNDMKVYRDNPRLLWLIGVATLPAVLFGFLFGDTADKLVFSEIVVASLIVFGSFVLFICDKFFAENKTLKDVNIKSAFVIGLMQIIALIPGVSRSGMTISGARFCGLSRVDAARFSFLISAPIIAGAGIMMLEGRSSLEFNDHVLTGMVVSFISAIATIHYFLAFIRKVSYAVFLYYSIAFFILVSIIFYL